MFDTYFEIEAKMEGYTVHTIERKDAKPWIMKKHYAKRMPSISHSFGLFKNSVLQGVCTFGLPASPFLCKGICGEQYRNLVIEFNRLCLDKNIKNEGSFFLSRAIKQINGPRILVSYADTRQGHIGYVYQATNWTYTGITKKMFDKKIQGKHGRHNNVYENPDIDYEIVERSQKHRYIYFIGSKKQKKEMLKALKYPILPYPKGESKRYDTSAEFPKQVQMF